MRNHDRIVVEKHCYMQRLKNVPQKPFLVLLVFILFSLEQAWSDDLEDASEAYDAPLTANLIEVAKSCIKTAKKRGTVWLKTQQALEQLLIFERDGADARARQTAEQISHDCRLISNQHALEQARYLLSTMESKGVDDNALGAIRAQLSAADGDASLALARNLLRELEGNSNVNSPPD